MELRAGRIDPTETFPSNSFPDGAAEGRSTVCGGVDRLRAEGGLDCVRKQNEWCANYAEMLGMVFRRD